MFIIASEKNKVISWPVSVEVAADGGTIKKYEFTGKFKLLDDDQREALAEEAKSNASAEDADTTNQWKQSSVDNIMKVMVDWSDVADETKTPIDFTRDSLMAAARSPHGVSILRAINTAIIEITTGARAKN